MKNKTSIPAMITFIFVSVIFISFGKQIEKWKGTIEEENGVKVIRNPNDPLYGEIKFELEEDLSIGNEEDENYAFYDSAYLHKPARVVASLIKMGIISYPSAEKGKDRVNFKDFHKIFV